MKITPEYKTKTCIICHINFNPTSPKQKYCSTCKNDALKESQKVRDKKRNRQKHNKIFELICPSCGTTFETFDSKKKYCGKEACEIYRLRLKNSNTHIKRCKDYMIEKGRKYYHNNKQNILLTKAEKYREIKGDVGEYIPGKTIALSLDFVKDYIEKENYKLISTVYVNNRDSLELLCPEGHEWQTSFHNFKDSSNRCGICYQQNNYVSKPEQLVRGFISENFPDTIVEYNNRSVIPPKELDFYFPEHNLAIEVCGLYWHGEIAANKSRDYHYSKMISCYEKGIRLITIFEDELYDYKDVVFSRIRQALGKPSRRIYARKCQVRELSSKEANSFYSSNHVQGKSNALVRYGLYYNDELVCVGSLGKLGRKHTSDEFTLELKRFCTLPNVSVIGGVGKIFKMMKIYALENNIKEIKSYCDMRYANIFNPVYEVLGFSLLTFTKYTPHYFKAQKRYRNMSLRKTPEERLTGLTEWELRKDQGYDRIWDCGHRTYVYKID